MPFRSLEYGKQVYFYRLPINSMPSESNASLYIAGKDWFCSLGSIQQCQWEQNLMLIKMLIMATFSFLSYWYHQILPEFHILEVKSGVKTRRWECLSFKKVLLLGGLLRFQIRIQWLKYWEESPSNQLMCLKHRKHFIYYWITRQSRNRKHKLLRMIVRVKSLCCNV
jgi:hypothetical protein